MPNLAALGELWTFSQARYTTQLPNDVFNRYVDTSRIVIVGPTKNRLVPSAQFDNGTYVPAIGSILHVLTKTLNSQTAAALWMTEPFSDDGGPSRFEAIYADAEAGEIVAEQAEQFAAQWRGMLPTTLRYTPRERRRMANAYIDRAYHSDNLAVWNCAIVASTASKQSKVGALEARIRRQILRADPICRYCMSAPSNTVDHVWPVSLGGCNHMHNLVGCCKACNEKKGSFHPRELGMKLHLPLRLVRSGEWKRLH